MTDGGREGQLAATGLRPGWTTGACATAAARAAYVALTTGTFPDPVTIALPKGRTPAFALTSEASGPGWAQAAVTKDAGDDPDVTHGAVVRVTVRHGEPGSGVLFVAGHGVGTVTLPGLPLPVGEPAINPVPRALIAEAVEGADVVVEVAIDQGEQMARHTWNPRLGIVGGLSVLGTTGVVIPYSCSAWIDSIRSGIDVAQALGVEHVAGCTGATSERVVRELYPLADQALLDMGDFVGAMLKHLRRHPRPRLTICGGFAKLSKLADGHLDLHSGRSQVDVEHLQSLAGPGVDLTGSNTALEALQRALAAGIPLGDLVAHRARDEALRVLGDAPVTVDVVAIDRAGTVVGRCDPASPR